MTPTPNWRKALISSNASIKDAIRSLSSSALQIVLVVSEDELLLGTITDGDIRRGLLRDLDMDSSIEDILSRQFIVVPPDMDRKSVISIMRANKVTQIPVVDDNGRVVGLHLWDEVLLPADRSNWVVIMAGGLGTRLKPYTKDCPKPLLPVGDKPMLEHIIERARQEGFDHFLLAVHYLGYMIEEYCGDGSQWQVKIDYLREESPLGTAGALSLMTPRPKEPFVVSNGDVLTDIRYGELLDFHSRHSASATMAVRMHDWQHPFGVVRTNGVDIIGIEEKPVTRTHVNAGVYVLAPDALDELQPGEHCDMPSLFLRLKDAGKRVIVYPIHEPWLDVGRPDDLKEAKKNTKM